ncbi:MAG: insulinase family protein [Acidobacteria bacterium]|nr:insulinase family protein [Acidobacteriota bacterium]
MNSLYLRDVFMIKNLRVATILFVAVAFASAAAFAQPAIAVNDASKLVTEFEVNGLKVLVKQRPAAPTFSGGLFFKGGVRNYTAETAGIENFMLNVATEAGKRFNRQQVRRELSRTGSSLAGSAGSDFGVVSFVSTKENFDRIWNVFTDVTLEPAFAPEDVERVRQQLLAGLRERETSPDAALTAAQERVLYSGHPYGIDSQGTIPTVQGFTAAQLREHHKKLMQTSRMLLVIVGDIDPKLVLEKVEAAFGKLPRGDYKHEPLPQLDFSKQTLDVTNRSLQTNYVQGAFPAPSLADPDFYAMRVAVTILQQLVYQEVRIERQLSYAPNAEMNNQAVNYGFLYVTTVDPNQSVKVMLDQVNLLRTQTVTDEFISGMAGQFVTQYYTDQQTNAAQAAELARYELLGGGWKRSFEFLDRMTAVTPADVRRVSEKYLKNFRFVVVGDPRSADPAVFTAQSR